MSASSPTSAQTRALYRSLLRELPHRPSTSTHPVTRRAPTSTSSSSSPLRSSIRSHLSSPDLSTSASAALTSQTLQYLKAQRTYNVLLDRYNPGHLMDEEERVRLSARRVGMEMPVEWYGEAKSSGGAGKGRIEVDRGSMVGKWPKPDGEKK